MAGAFQQISQDLVRTTYQTVDLRLRKDFPQFAGTRRGVTADLFNLFTTANLGCFDETAIFNNGTPNANFGNAGCVIGDTRRFQLGRPYDS